MRPISGLVCGNSFRTEHLIHRIDVLCWNNLAFFLPTELLLISAARQLDPPEVRLYQFVPQSLSLLLPENAAK